MCENDLALGDLLRLQRNSVERVVEVTDFPDDASMITLEPSLTADEDEIICGIEESEGWRDTPVVVGWHIDSFDDQGLWEIVEIIKA